MNPLHARLRAEARVAITHLGAKAYADLLGITIPRLRAEHQQAGNTQVVAWGKLSTPVLKAMLDDYQRSRENATRFCSRHGYSVTGFTKTMAATFPAEWDTIKEHKRPATKNHYRTGRNLEHRIRNTLEHAGWFVIRSAASKTPVDLVAAKHGTLWLIQCKRSGALPPAEWNALIDAAHQAGGTPILVEHPHHGTINWWQLRTHKRGRGTGTKTRIPPPHTDRA